MDDTAAACVTLGRSHGFEEEHCRQDAWLAVRLFDLTSDLHRLGDEYRDLLYYAGLLHDIGYAEGYEQHHKTAYRLIRQADLPGLTDRERQIVANVARYHRGARPSLTHKGFAALVPEDREIVEKLAALLRLADGLDRSHTAAVRNVGLQYSDDQAIVWVDCPGGCSDEIWAVEKKGRFFGDVFGVHLAVRVRQGR
jgi:exopolyphosphatase/guanosine-5'-triphosphate,3'-diphosphate pyrophosphatase